MISSIEICVSLFSCTGVRRFFFFLLQRDRIIYYHVVCYFFFVCAIARLFFFVFVLIIISIGSSGGGGCYCRMFADSIFFASQTFVKVKKQSVLQKTERIPSESSINRLLHIICTTQQMMFMGHTNTHSQCNSPIWPCLVTKTHKNTWNFFFSFMLCDF